MDTCVALDKRATTRSSCNLGALSIGVKQTLLNKDRLDQPSLEPRGERDQPGRLGRGSKDFANPDGLPRSVYPVRDLGVGDCRGIGRGCEPLGPGRRRGDTAANPAISDLARRPQGSNLAEAAERD